MDDMTFGSNKASSEEWPVSPMAHLPFFSPAHRGFIEELRAWGEHSEPDIAHALSLEPDEAVRRLVRLLGEGGWFARAVDGSIDIRQICLARDMMACRHDLLDYAYSIQLLAALPIALHADDALKASCLPGLLSGERIGAFALTEKESGTDIGSVMLRADEPEPERFTLSGRKCWIANAPIADDVLVLARTGSGAGTLGLSMFIVDATQGGVTFEPVDLIAPRPFGHLSFETCAVDASRIVGDRGLGIAVAIDTLERCRITVGAAAAGFARRAFLDAHRHALDSAQRSKKLSDIPAVRQILGDMAASVNAAQLIVGQAANEMDQKGARMRPLSSLAKLAATEAAQKTVDQCVQLNGANGLVAGTVPEALYRAIRSLRIYEGASEVQAAIWADAVVSGQVL